MLEKQMETLREFLQTEVCDKLRFKIPTQRVYDVKWGKPVATCLYLPVDINQNLTAPCVTVIPAKGEDSDNGGYITMFMQFAIWDPGTRLPGAATTGELIDDREGWRAISTFIDTARRALVSNRIIGNLLLTQFPLKYGILIDEDGYDPRGYIQGFIEATFEYERDVPQLTDNPYQI